MNNYIGTKTGSFNLRGEDAADLLGQETAHLLGKDINIEENPYVNSSSEIEQLTDTYTDNSAIVTNIVATPKLEEEKEDEKPTENSIERADRVNNQIDKEETHALLQVFDINQELVISIDDFILESSEEASQEKMQIMETFDDFYIFFYGRKPKIYSYAGKLLNFQNLPWKDTFIGFYEMYSGTPAVNKYYICWLSYDEKVYKGYIINFRRAQSAMNINIVAFAFDFIVIGDENPYQGTPSFVMQEEESTEIEGDSNISENEVLSLKEEINEHDRNVAMLNTPVYISPVASSSLNPSMATLEELQAADVIGKNNALSVQHAMKDKDITIDFMDGLEDMADKRIAIQTTPALQTIQKSEKKAFFTNIA